MKKKRFQLLSNLRKYITNNLCWRIKKKNKRKQKIEDIEAESHLSSQQTSTKRNPDISTQTSAGSDLEFRELFSKDIFSLEDDNSLLILLTEGNVWQQPFPVVRRNILPVIPLPWITKTSDIREGNTIEMQIEVPIMTRYEELQRSWITSRIFECSVESYPSLLIKMQVVPYVCKKSLLNLHIIAAALNYKYEQLTRAVNFESTNRESFLIVRRETLKVIPLPWITKTSDIRDGNTIQMQIKVPITTKYEELERSWIISRIFECSLESYPSLPTNMQVVPWVCHKSLFYLHLISGSLCYEYVQLTRKLESTSQGPFLIMSREILQVIPLLWITKTSDIREGNTIEMQIGVPITTRYEELERSWITSRIFECSMESYPSLLTKMQVVSYVCKKSLFYLHVIAGILYYKYEQLTRAVYLESTNQGAFPGEKRNTLHVIPLRWIMKTSDIREGNTVEMQIGVPITTRYEELERSWITSRIFDCSMESYPSLLTKMQVVPYVCKKSLFHLHLISGIYYCEYKPLTRAGKLESTNQGSMGDMESADSGTSLNNSKAVQVTADIHTIKCQPGSENQILKLPSPDTLKVNWSLLDITIKEIHLTALLGEDGDYKKLYKGYYGDTHFVASDYRRIPKKLDMNDLGRLRSPNLPELFGILQYNSHRWIIYVEAKFGDLFTLLKKDLHRTVFGEDSAKFVTVRLMLALAYLQTHGVVHGDIRPSKILINNMGMPMLGGLETVTWSSNRTLVRKSPKSMKIGFVAPEVLTGFRPQQASDIFSLGCVAYFIITGRRPFTKRNELLNKMKSPELLDKKISPAGIEFITACLQKSTERRFQLGPGLKYVRQNEWLADMDIDEEFPVSPLMKAIEHLNKDEARVEVKTDPNARQ